MNKTYTLNVYNTLTGKYENVNVSEKIYREFQRTKWEIENKNSSYYAHEIQMSALTGSANEQYENFREFINFDDTPEKLVLDEMQLCELKQIVAKLSKEEQALIQAIFVKGMSEREYAKQLGVFQNAVHKRKLRIIKKIKIFLGS